MRVAESPFVKFAEAEQQYYAQRDRKTLERVLFFAWFAGRFGELDEITWPELRDALEIVVTPPQVEAPDPDKETRVRQILNAAGVLSKKTWAAQEGLDWEQEQRNLPAESQAEAEQTAKTGPGARPTLGAAAEPLWTQQCSAIERDITGGSISLVAKSPCFASISRCERLQADEVILGILIRRHRFLILPQWCELQ